MGKKRPKSKPVKQLVASAAKESSASEAVPEEMIAAAIGSIPQTVLMKVCRLCETKDGPFLNIYDADKMTAKKIEEVMPFGIAENDDLPHKICFRCSAKVEELYEFIHKCIKTQENLRTAMGKRGPLITKTKTRMLWEEKLNKTNLSNEDICNALIKKAMEGIKDIPLNPSEEEKQPLAKKVKSTTEPEETSRKEKESIPMSSKNNISYQSDDDPDDISLKQVMLTADKCENKVPLTRMRANKAEVTQDDLVQLPKKSKQYPSRKSQNKIEPVENHLSKNKLNESNQNEDQKISAVGSDAKNNDKSDKEKPKETLIKEKEPAPPINIMDHVSTIKVNGVGTLFLCKLCNRNFLKKEVVLTHGCAKNNVPKDSFMQNHVPPPEVPKPPTVKYIKMDKDFKKPVTTDTKSIEKKPLASDAIRVNIPVQSETKFKPHSSLSNKQAHPAEVPKEPTPPPAKPSVVAQVDKVLPSVQFPGIPSLNSRYKLVPGPNNTFTLVEESASVEENSAPVPPLSKIKNKKRKATNESSAVQPLRPPVTEKESSPEVIELDDNVAPQPAVIEQPYPVGLFQTVPHHSGVFPPNNHPQPPAFTTPAMKKQSYTIVQTGNPSKLLISTKPQPVTEEPQRKKSKKIKADVRDGNKEPYNVVIEENTPPKDAGFFTFINVDPLLQPSYVLPTDNIIQESQISTSTPAAKGILDNKEKEKYSCNMCDEKFSREKKLLAHIQSHYNQMDEEDQQRAEKTGSKRKSRKM